MRQKNLEGRTFGRLTALYPTDKRDYKGSVIWHCRCACGNELDLSACTLVHGTQRSCGCRKIEQRKELVNHLGYVAGTSAVRIKRREANRSSQTGVLGVYQKRGRYCVEIAIQKKSYYLGSYKELEVAKQVRKEAEHAVFDGFLNYYERYQKIASENPGWKEQNPIQLEVHKDNGQELTVEFSPRLEQYA